MFKGGDKVKFTFEGYSDPDIGIVHSVEGSYIWVNWPSRLSGIALPYLSKNLILIEKKQNHPHTTIFK
jgi:hypothetical protein